MKKLFPLLILCGLLACSSQDSLEMKLETADVTPDKVRLNALISCLDDADVLAKLSEEDAFEIVDYFGEAASLGGDPSLGSNLGASRLQDPWCLLTVDVAVPETLGEKTLGVEAVDADIDIDAEVPAALAKGAKAKLEYYLNAEPDISLRALSLESPAFGQDRGARSFDPQCDDMEAVDKEASAARGVRASSLRSLLGVSDEGLTGAGINIAVLDGGVSEPEAFVKASPVAKLSRSFLESDYPKANASQSDIRDKFDCAQTPQKEGHGGPVTDLIKSVAPEANLVMFKVCNDNGSCPSSSLAKALLYMGNRYEGFPKIDIINMSFGGHLAEQDAVLRALIERMTGGNWETLLVASMGNSAETPNHYPADYYNLHYGLVPVAAAKATLQRPSKWQVASFNTQAVMKRTRYAALAAPGVGLVLPGRDEALTGTSFATPIVSAMAALERQKRPLHNLSATSLHVSLLRYARPHQDFKLVHFRE